MPWRTEPQPGRRIGLRNRRMWHASQCVTPERFREGMRRKSRTGPGCVEHLACSYPLVGTAGQTELIRPSAYHASLWTRVGAPQTTGDTEDIGTSSRTTVRIRAKPAPHRRVWRTAAGPRSPGIVTPRQPALRGEPGHHAIVRRRIGCCAARTTRPGPACPSGQRGLSLF